MRSAFLVMFLSLETKRGKKDVKKERRKTTFYLYDPLIFTKIHALNAITSHMCSLMVNK